MKMDSGDNSEPSFFRRRWKLLLSLGIGILAVGLGVGLGVYFGTKDNSGKRESITPQIIFYSPVSVVIF